MSRGIPGLAPGGRRLYANRFGSNIDPERETIVTLGSKEGLPTSPGDHQPGDVMLVPNPSYPIPCLASSSPGAAIRPYPPTEPKDFVAALERAWKHSVPAPIALIVITRPTRPPRSATWAFMPRSIDFCRGRLYVLSDLAYSEIYFDDVPPPSILAVPGARGSRSNSAAQQDLSMPVAIGYAGRLGQLIDALARVKSYLDYGAFTPVQSRPSPP